MNTEQELTELIQRTQAKARERLAELDDERRFLETFIGVNGTVPGTTSEPATPVPTRTVVKAKRVVNRKSPKRDAVYELLADGHKRSAKRVARELKLSPGSASSLLSHLYLDGMIEREGNRRHMRYFRVILKHRAALKTDVVAEQPLVEAPKSTPGQREAESFAAPPKAGTSREAIEVMLSGGEQLSSRELHLVVGGSLHSVHTLLWKMEQYGILTKHGPKPFHWSLAKTTNEEAA